MCEFRYGMVIHCDTYWENMERMVENFKNGVYPIDEGIVDCRGVEK